MDRSNSDGELLKRVTQDFMSPSSHMAMPPKGDNLSLTEVQLRDALKYMKIVFGR